MHDITKAKTGDGMMDMIRHKKVKTRVEHACFGCGETFPKNYEMYAVTQSESGEINTTHWCVPCQDWVNDDPNEYGYLEGEVGEHRF